MSSAIPSAKSAFTNPTLPHEKKDDNEFGELSSSSGQRPNYYVADTLGPISGFTNYGPREMRVTATWKTALADLYRLNGFTPIDTRPVELAQNLLISGGAEKQIYGISRLQDGSITKLGIPFDRTLPLAVFIAQHDKEITFPYARYDIGWAFRGEHATKGRYRAFIQADCDIIDKSLDFRADGQCIVTLIKGLQKLGVKKCSMLVNHIGIAREFLQNAGIPSTKFKEALRVIDKLKPDNREEVIKEFTSVISELDSKKAEELLDQMDYRGSFIDFKFPFKPSDEAVASLVHLQSIENMVSLMGVEKGVLQFAPNLARGLDYYTGVVFETFIPGKEKYGSVSSGGRYDNLVGDFNPKIQLQGIGGSIGLTRLFDVMLAENGVDLSKQTTSQILVGYRTMDEGCFEKALEVATALRNLGVNTELYTSDVKMKKELQLANKKGIPYTVLVMNKDEIVFKRQNQKDQETFKSIEELEKYVKTVSFEETTQFKETYESKSNV